MGLWRVRSCRIGLGVVVVIDVLGSATTPGAGTAIATTGTLPSGLYEVVVTTSLEGTIAAATDENNFQLQVGATVLGGLSSEGVVGVPFENPMIPVTVPAAGAAITVNAIGAGTSGAVYKAQITATP